MASPVSELQAALLTRLNSSAALRGYVGGRVWDLPDADPDYPFVVFGPLAVTRDDTMGGTGLAVEVALQIASSPTESQAATKTSGRIETLEIADLIAGLLHYEEDNINVQNATLIGVTSCVHNRTRVFYDIDENLYVGEMTFTITLEISDNG